MGSLFNLVAVKNGRMISNSKGLLFILIYYRHHTHAIHIALKIETNIVRITKTPQKVKNVNNKGNIERRRKLENEEKIKQKLHQNYTRIVEYTYRPRIAGDITRKIKRTPPI